MIESGCADCTWWTRVGSDWGECRLSADAEIEGIPDEARQFRVHGPVLLTTSATFGCTQFHRNPEIPFALRP